MSQLIISTTRLVSGDVFTINPQATAELWIIEFVSTQPSTMQALDTTSITPTSEEWKAAVERLTDALRDCAVFTSVDSDTDATGTKIICSSDQDLTHTAFNPNFGNGSEIVFVSLIKNNGVRLDFNNTPSVFDDFLVPNIAVSDVDHDIIDFTGLATTSDIRGNPGNYITSTITFDTRDSLTGKQVDFSFGLIQNTTNPYGQSVSIDNPFAIDPTLFENRVTGNVQTYRGD